MSESHTAEIVTGDLLNIETDYIVHQCNCLSVGRAGGLASSIFKKFPWADIYVQRQGTEPPLQGEMPGDHRIIIPPKELEAPRVISIFGQFRPGGPSSDPRSVDHSEARFSYFSKALFNIYEEVILRSTIAFPWQIGCGIAGGDWENKYLPEINRFADKCSSFDSNKVIIVRRPGD